jgi:CheY-like chemotaxis protein
MRPALPLGSGERVLVVEDDATLRGSLVDLLGKWNYTVAQAADGQDALNYLWHEPVDVIVCDAIMPRLGGIALIKALRQQGINTPAIFMSGHALDHERSSLDGLDVWAWLDKPPSNWRLAQAVIGALGSRREHD